MGFANYINNKEIRYFMDITEQHNLDNTLNHKQPIDLYYRKRFHDNYKIDEHVSKNYIPKMFSLLILTKKKTHYLLQEI